MQDTCRLLVKAHTGDHPVFELPALLLTLGVLVEPLDLGLRRLVYGPCELMSDLLARHGKCGQSDLVDETCVLEPYNK